MGRAQFSSRVYFRPDVRAVDVTADTGETAELAGLAGLVGLRSWGIEAGLEVSGAPECT